MSAAKACIREAYVRQPQVDPSPVRETGSPLTGTFGVSLTRAVLPYPDAADPMGPGGRIGDIGLGVVVDGTDPVRADVVDLGSAETRVVDLTGPLVVLGWLYPSGLRTLERVVSESDDREQASGFAFDMALRALRAAGFTPLTRPTFLRIGFRDLCQDLDLHEGTAVRLVLPSEGVARIHLDYESVTLVARTGRSVRSRDLESALVDAFGAGSLFRGVPRDPAGIHAYHLPLPVPRDFHQLRQLVRKLRRGLVHLLARFEPERYRALREITGTFGERDSLRSLEDVQSARRLEPVGGARTGRSGLGGVH